MAEDEFPGEWLDGVGAENGVLEQEAEEESYDLDGLERFDHFFDDERRNLLELGPLEGGDELWDGSQEETAKAELNGNGAEVEFEEAAETTAEFDEAAETTTDFEEVAAAWLDEVPLEEILPDEMEEDALATLLDGPGGLGLLDEELKALSELDGAPDFGEDVEVAVEDELAEMGGADEDLGEALESAPSDDEKEDSEDSEAEGLQEHLKDAVEGTLRLKRLLSQDEETLGEANGSGKRRKVREEEVQYALDPAKVGRIAAKWGLAGDPVVKHVLEGLALEELDHFLRITYVPDKSGAWKSAGEHAASYVADMREKKGPDGGPVDTAVAFGFKWKLDAAAVSKLRGLKHKELRYVLNEYDGTRPLEEILEEAVAADPEDVEPELPVPQAAGVLTVGRFNRLELIDPEAQAAVFGDANLTFSLKLAKHRKAFGHKGPVIATTFEPLDVLKQRYQEIEETIKSLHELGAEVYHGVDCTRIAVDPRFKGMEGNLGAVYYNYPHAGAVTGFFDGHPLVNWRHENLMRLFFRALRSFVKPGGWVKVASNRKAVGVRYSYIIGSALQNEFHHVETLPFKEWHLHRYGRSYGDRRDAHKRPGQGQGYNAQRADADMVYTFQYFPTGSPLGKQEIRHPPRVSTLLHCLEGPFKKLDEVGRKRLAGQLFKRFVTEIKGTHVG